jgi:cytochrome c-type biogenesis protein CcmH/NrfF
MTWVLWFGPFLLLAAAVWGMFSYIRQRQSAQTAGVALSDADRHKVQAILKSGDAP